MIEDTLAGGYGPFDTNLISYTYYSGAFTAAIALEQGVGNYFTDSDFEDVYGTHNGWGIDDYMPHIVVGLGYSAGMFNLTAVGAYDTRDDVFIPDGAYIQQLGGWAGKIRADVTFNDRASVIAGGSFKFSDKATFNVQAGARQACSSLRPWIATFVDQIHGATGGSQNRALRGQCRGFL